MKVYYDDEVDALYLELGEGQPDGVTELTDGINLDVSPGGRLLGIEVLHASQRLDLGTVLSYSLELDQSLLHLPRAGHPAARGRAV
jgi:uncharacterized protein YuzE